LVESVGFEGDQMWVGRSDGSVIGVPLSWFPRLAAASADERAAIEMSPFVIHWEGLVEDVSVEGLLAGRGDPVGGGEIGGGWRGCVRNRTPREFPHLPRRRTFPPR
jgi:hypothetical protein